MKALLLVALVSGQIYEWVDQNGDSHFTDDVSTIPAGVKRRVMEGAEPVLTVTREPRDAGARAAPPDAGVVRRAEPPPRPPGPNSCERAREKIAALESSATLTRQRHEDSIANRGARCNSALARGGRAGYATCMAGDNGASEARMKATLEKNAAEQDAAREELRRAQVDGCR